MNHLKKDYGVNVGTLLTVLFMTIGTSHLKFHFGLNSPVTAGVLCGERCRFQLFGDTVNIAARIERNTIYNPRHQQINLSDRVSRIG